MYKEPYSALYRISNQSTCKVSLTGMRIKDKLLFKEHYQQIVKVSEMPKITLQIEDPKRCNLT